jgi:hypothetical protein
MIISFPVRWLSTLCTTPSGNPLFFVSLPSLENSSSPKATLLEDMTELILLICILVEIRLGSGKVRRLFIANGRMEKLLEMMFPLLIK